MKGTLRLSQEKYIRKVLEKLNIKDVETRCQPLGDHFKLSKKQAPKTEASRRRMAKVLYASVVGSVMYVMAEYMAIVEAGKELVWLKNFLEELDRAQTECVLFSGNPSAIHLAKNLVFTVEQN
nr:retrovirus-related Pol polyprotein from transposon TNT 1-94 [Tanacetum cinerariifolium]